MSVYMGDFLGFQLGDIHSYSLNITRISTNDRYIDGLIPTLQDITVQVPGGDGTYYFDTYYTQKIFTIDFAFDDLRDEDLRALRQMFSFKGIRPLIFDEFPYKKYMVKVAQPPQLKYIPFDNWEFRIYKGEGSVQLIAYYPFAFGVISPLLATGTSGIINNNGDIPANLEIIFNGENLSSTTELQLIQDEKTIGYLKLNSIIMEPSDTYILVNTKNFLIEGLDASFNKTGTLYNKYIEAGDFFNPPVGKTTLVSNNEFLKAKYTPLFY